MTKATVELPLGVLSSSVESRMPRDAKLTLEFNVPGGYVFEGFKVPEDNDSFLTKDAGVCTPEHRGRIPLLQPRLIVKRVYRTPVMPDDFGKECQFSDDPSFRGETCRTQLAGYAEFAIYPFCTKGGNHFKYARIDVEPAPTYRTPMLADVGKECEFSDCESFGCTAHGILATAAYTPWKSMSGISYRYARIKNQ